MGFEHRDDFTLYDQQYKLLAGGTERARLLQAPEKPEVLASVLSAFYRAYPEARQEVFYLGPDAAERPFYPLLDYVRQSWSDFKPQLKNKVFSGLYHGARTFLQSWMETGLAEINHDVLAAGSELAWERTSLTESVYRLFDLWNDKPMILVFQHLENASSSLLTLLEMLLSRPGSGKILLVDTFDRFRRDNSHDFSPQWYRFCQVVADSVNVIDMNYQTLEDPLDELFPNQDWTPPSEPEDPDIQLQRIKTALAFYQTDEAATGLERLQALGLKRLEFSGPTNLLAFYEAQGDCHFLQDKQDQALFHYNKLLNQAQTLNLGPWIALANYKIGLAFFRKSDQNMAQVYLRKAQKISLDYNDAGFAARLMVYILILSDSAQTSQRVLTEYDEALIQLELCGYHNLRLVLLSRGPYVIGLFRERSPDQARRVAADALELAQRYKHTYRLAQVYHTVGLVHQMAHEREAALDSYRKSIRLRKQLGDTLELIKIYNGTGFFCFSGEDFPTAKTYFEKALTLLEDVRDFEEIGLTLFNLALVHFYTLDYAGARQEIEKMLQLRQELDLSDQPFHSDFEIRTFLGFSCFRSGRPTKALENYRLCKNLTEGRQSFVLPLFKLWEALIVLESGEPMRGIKLGRRAAQDAFDENYPSNGLHHLLELGLALKRLKLVDYAREVLAEGASGASQLRQPYYQKLFAKAQESSQPPTVPMPAWRKSGFSLTTLLTAARQSKDLSRLHSQIGEINFINNLQRLIFQQDDRQQFLSKALELIKNTFLAEAAHLVETRDGEPVQVTSLGQESDPDFSARQLFGRLKTRGSELLLRLPDPDLPLGCNCLVFLLLLGSSGVRGALILTCGKSRFTLEDKDLRVLTIGAQQMSLALDLQEANQNLLRAATTDFLTGLLNRKEFILRMTEERKRLTRFVKEALDLMGIFFIDLDNFKYCNDTYGHPAGDLVIREFANLLKSCLREIDLASRFGGDEFVLFLPQIKADGIQIIIDRIYEKLAEADYFRPQLQEFLGTEIQIDDDHKLTCSIGIRLLPTTSLLDAEDFLAQADQALYRAKQKGKFTAVIYQ